MMSGKTSKHSAMGLRTPIRVSILLLPAILRVSVEAMQLPRFSLVADGVSRGGFALARLGASCPNRCYRSCSEH